MLPNMNNYYIYTKLVKTGSQLIKSDSINISNWRNHYDGILNIMKDGIDTKEVQNMFVTVDFGNGDSVDLAIPDYFFNLTLWYSIIALEDETIKPYHVVFLKYTTSKDVKKFIDNFFILKRRMNVNNKTMNNVIADCLYSFSDVDEFAFYLANTLNLEDSIDLMDACPEYDKLMHCDLSDVPIERVKDKGLEIVHNAMDYIMDGKKIMGHEHCLRNPFAAEEGINVKQYKENSFNIGTKPDGQGSIYHDIINQSYITGGLNNLLYEFIDCGASRVAQIISKKNVAASGGFARILGLNNLSTFLNPDVEYDCHTNNLAHIFIKNRDVFNHFLDRYARLSMNGQEFLITPELESTLVGQWIYLRTPAMCASHAAGHGICHKCYGELARTNLDISVGRIAAEIVTNQYTQMRLSAKHLLEAMVKIINWIKDFYKFFKVDTNSINVNEETFKTIEDMQGWNIIIKTDDVQLENDDDFFKHIFYSNDAHSMEDGSELYNEYITDFYLESPNGDRFPICSIPDNEDDTKSRMYISNGLSAIIRSHIGNSDEDSEIEEIVIPVTEVQDIDLFFLKMENNDLGKALDIFTDLINKKDVTKTFDISTLIMKLVNSVIKGKIHCRAIHLEVILSNQIRDINDRMKMPDWRNFNEPYEVLTLNEALTDNPSPIISFNYQNLNKALSNPKTYTKVKSSPFDPFYMHKPIKFMNVDHEVWDEPNKKAVEGSSPIVFVNNKGIEYSAYDDLIKKANTNNPKTSLED